MVALDICNTLANINAILAHRFKISMKRYPAEIPADFWTSPYGLRVFRDAPPLGDAAEAATGMARALGGVVYVTSRPREAEFITYAWLKKHCFPKGKVIFCSREEKLRVYTALDPAIVAEDDPEVIKELANAGMTVLVPQWRYNRHLRGEQILPIKDQWDVREGVLW